MPIQTNFAIETAFFHVPIPATQADVRRLNAIWQRYPLRKGRIAAYYVSRSVILKVVKPVVLLAIADQYWRELGRLIKRTGEPWWDICAIVADSEPQEKKPQAHALSLYRITARGEMHYLHSDTPEALWPEQYPVPRKCAGRTKTKASPRKKWKFSTDLLGIFDGPRDLSARKIGVLRSTTKRQA